MPAERGVVAQRRDAGSGAARLSSPRVDLSPIDFAIAQGIPCPRCGACVEHLPREWLDSLRSLWRPVRRYRCRSMACGWRGAMPWQPAGPP